MHGPADNFHLLDLHSQAEAVQSLLAGRTLDDKVEWFDAHGTLTLASRKAPGGEQIYHFQSTIGFESIFFIVDDDLVFIGDNTTWTVPRRDAAANAVGAGRQRKGSVRTMLAVSERLRTLLVLGAYVAGAVVLWPLFMAATALGGIPAGVVVLIAVPACLWYFLDRPGWLRRHRLRWGHCEHCGYDLTGNTSGVCPECGQAA